MTFSFLIGAQTIVKVEDAVKLILPLIPLHTTTNLILRVSSYLPKFSTHMTSHLLVPGGRVELPLSLKNRILSPARLPVPPSGRQFLFNFSLNDQISTMNHITGQTTRAFHDISKIRAS